MRTSLFAILIVLAASWARATETEHLGFQILPAPGKVTVDGKFDDWDLTGGILTCSDVENSRDKFSVWFHATWDAQSLYLLARWNDETPLNNPGTSKGDYGFAGDCLQFRLITAPDTPNERCGHFTAWRDRDNVDAIDVEWGRQFNQGKDKDLKAKGALQAFTRNADNLGYVQEIAIPWSLLCKEGTLKGGDRMVVTIEPNFTIGSAGRLSLKDIFKPNMTLDRVFTFMANQQWGIATLENKGKLTPRAVRLTDGREFAVKIEKGVPVVDWTGLIKSKDLKGFKEVSFSLPEDGNVSLVIRNKDGQVVRQLLSNVQMSKGKKTVKWDGLTTPSVTRPGEPVPAGDYAWSAIWHKPITLALRGWAMNGGSAPWDGNSGKENWGGDHGVPACCATDDQKVYLGWNAAEAGKALLATDLDGNVQWKNSRGGMAGAELVAVDGGTVYVQNWKGNLYRVDSVKGGYTDWEGRGSTDLSVRELVGDPAAPESASAMAAFGGKLFVSLKDANVVAVADAKSGKLLKKLDVKAPGDLEAAAADKLLVISEGTTILAVNPDNGQAAPLITGLKGASGIAVDKAGNVYVGVRDPDNHVLAFSPDGKQTSTIGRKGGRPLLGKWEQDGMRFMAGMAVDAAGKLWVMEADECPKRVSVWDTKTGKFVKEFFGPTSYGALGGAISPRDPNIVVGRGCEWKIDEKTGKAACTGTFTRDGMEVARFCVGSNGKLYLAVAAGWFHGPSTISIFERAGEADYKLRSAISYESVQDAANKDKKNDVTVFWADANGDGRRQDNEARRIPGTVRLSGWYMSLSPDMTFVTTGKAYRCLGFTACGAPLYDLAKPQTIPAPAGDNTGVLCSADGKRVLYGGPYGQTHGLFSCFDIESGKLLWTYPDNFTGVHGSHNACPPEVGMVRGSFGPCGSATLPDPIGNIWVIPTNVGEWHILTQDGYYLTHLFQADPMKIQWPDAAVPGAQLTNAPCGMGGEDFGGSIAATTDGRLFLQAGKTGFWNVEVLGLDTAKAIKGGKLSISGKDVNTARSFREQYLQEAAGKKSLVIRKATPAFTGDLAKDFPGATVLEFRKNEAESKAAAAWDDLFLYLAWDVRDDSPWVNGADGPEFLYAHGDTVDFQLATDPKADPARGEAVLGDLRLSIGPFKGENTAVVYRLKAKDKNPKVFKSGVVSSYPMDSVVVVKDAKITVTKKQDGKGYAAEAAIPLAALGLKPADGLKLRGDFGVTFGDKAGQDTALRAYWSNQATGIVNDEVFELKMEPKNWGELQFAQ